MQWVWRNTMASCFAAPVDGSCENLHLRPSKSLWALGVDRIGAVTRVDRIALLYYPCASAKRGIKINMFKMRMAMEPSLIPDGAS